MGNETFELLIELGCEEIPSNFLRGLLEPLGIALDKLLASNDIAEGPGRVYGGPRRLVYHHGAVRREQASKTIEVSGPPVRVAYDAEAKPTKAAAGFARGQGVTVDDLYQVELPKGTFIACKTFIEGKSAATILGEGLPEVVRSMPQPKAMRWGANRFSFIRPVHWILALLGGEVLPVEIAGVTSSNETRGHRFRGNAPLAVASFADYQARMSEAEVIFDHEIRAEVVAAGLAERLAAYRAEDGSPDTATIVDDKADMRFLQQVADLCESPRVTLASFEERFLKVPAEILETAMMHHQRYFPIWADDTRRALQNRFAVVTNVPPSASESVIDTVRAGNERVLRARLADAEFFFNEDRKRRLEDFVEDLKGRIFLQGLGTVFDKVTRLETLCKDFSELIAGVAPDYGDPATTERANRAARLAKADLASNVVNEFPELQGTIGRYYATADLEAPEVAVAVEEHYLPRFQGDAIPSSREGTLCSLADKLDSIAGAFALGLIPSGSQDPYALRRQAIGVLRILLQDAPLAPGADRQADSAAIDLDARALVEAAIAAITAFDLQLAPSDNERRRLANEVTDFLLGRFRVMLGELGHDKSLVNAILSGFSANVTDLTTRLFALEEIAGSPDFEPMMIAFKRVMNISKDHTDTSVDPALFESASEADLADAFDAMATRFDEAMEARSYAQALGLIAGLKPAIDGFFDGVMVMAEDPAVRANRLGFMRAIAERFGRFADFSRIQF